MNRMYCGKFILDIWSNVEVIKMFGLLKKIDPKLLMAAQSGDFDAQYELGIRYLMGDGVVKDPATALMWLEKAAESDTGLMKKVSNNYMTGEHWPVNYDKAKEWLEKAVALSDAEAMFNLGLMYKQGKGIPQSFEKAIGLWEQAADLGVPDAQFNLGYLYEFGEHVEEDLKRSFEYYEMAAKQGYAKAQFNIMRVKELLGRR